MLPFVSAMLLFQYSIGSMRCLHTDYDSKLEGGGQRGAGNDGFDKPPFQQIVTAVLSMKID